MPEFVPKTASDLGNAKPNNDVENTEEFTPMQQRLESKGGSDNADKTTEFKNKEAVILSAPATTKTQPLKNIQTPSQVVNPDDPNTDSGGAAHKAKVKIVRNGDKITQIVVVCNCGETIPLDCIY